MGTCRGNLGNLMQHWVLSEVLVEMQRQFVGQSNHLLFTTTHSMAPWSVPWHLANPNKDYSRPRFDHARADLVHPDAAPYEQAWTALSGRNGLPYPSSAAFALQIWGGSMSFVLCEIDKAVAAEIQGWLALPEVRNRLLSAPTEEFHYGDWRERFVLGFGNPHEVHAVYAEIDPMRFERHGEEQCSRENRETLYVEDLAIIAAAFSNTSIPVVLQVSSFSAQRNNPHREVEPVISASLGQNGFGLQGKVEADGNMISLVYTRGLGLWQAPQLLGQRFADWASHR